MSPKKIKYVEPPIEPRRARKGTVEPIPEALITWRLTDVDVDGEWGWAKLTVDERSHLHDALVKLESKTLRALRHDRRLKYIPRDHICAEAQQRLIDTARDDTEQVVEIAVGVKKWRVWGIVRDSIFCPLWWDPHHTVCTGIPDGVPRR